MANISVTNTLNDNTATSDITKVGTNFTDLVNGLTDGTKDIGCSNISSASQFKSANGTVAAPGLSFTNSLSSGLYRIGANNLGLATAGTKAIEWDSSQNNILNGDIYSVVWTDYSGTSTVVGWSSFTTKVISYKKIGRLVFVQFYITGTSNATNATFTVPNTSATLTNGYYFAQVRTQDNSVDEANGYGSLASNSTTVTLLRSAGVAWTGSGGKTVTGQFWYEATS